ncbi:MAG: ribulose-phosphate 3-epimerase, partial [Minisyncoccales bacterium]
MAKIIPAILTASLNDLENKLRIIQNLTDWVQIDIMDGKFVKNVSISLADLKKIKIPLNLEVHLMVLNPEKYFRDCQNLKAKRVIFHYEATKNPKRVFEIMKKYDFSPGLAINPSTSVEKIKKFLEKLDLVLLLAVNPGFQGQKFNPIVLTKIKELKKLSKKIKIGVDGGI